MTLLLAFLASSIVIGQPQRAQSIAKFRNLAVYPIYEPIGKFNDSNYITLDEGLKNRTVTVSEKGGTTPISRPLPHGRGGQRVAVQQQGRSSSAEVNTLWLTNTSGKRLILISGEMVRGGQQDRIIGKDAIIPSGKESVDIGVYCVEHGRWSGEAKFAPAEASVGLAMPSLRKTTQAHDGKAGGQQEVWAKVEDSQKTAAVMAPTSAYRAIAEDKGVAKSLEEYVSAINKNFDLSKAVGVAIAINGEMVWVDRFSSNAMFRKYWQKLLRSYALGALTNQERKPSNPPSVASAMNFANTREGKTSYDVSEFKAKVIKIESKTTTVFRLEDLGVSPTAAIHESKVLKD